MVQINFREHARVWSVIDGTINISSEEAEQLKSGEIDLKSLMPEHDFEFSDSRTINILDDYEVEYELIDIEEL